MRNLLDILGNKEYLDVMKQRLLCKKILEDLTKKIEVITNGGNAEVSSLKDFFDSLEKYNSVFHVPKGLISL